MAIDNLIKKFKEYLRERGLGKVSVKNYAADVRGFLRWAKKVASSKKRKELDSILFSTYRSHLLSAKTPRSSVNRKLSSLRKFGQFLKDEKILMENPARGISNIPKAEIPRILNNFAHYLSKQRLSPISRKNYLSDIANFLAWVKKTTKWNLSDLPAESISQVIIEYKKRLLKYTTLSKRTINRKLSSLRRFADWAEKTNLIAVNPFKKKPKIKAVPKKVWAPLKVSLKGLPIYKKIAHYLRYIRPSWYKKYHELEVTHYFHWAILVIFCAALGFGIYDQVIRRARPAPAYPTALTPPNRYLSFQGRLTDSPGNPITIATDFVFKLWDQPSGGTEGTCTGQAGEDCLWSSDICAIQPDQDGIFSIILGSTCGSEIDASVFSENVGVWLEITVGTPDEDETLSPRQQIATVAYALNAETLQGYPPGTATSTIPYIDSTGKVVIAAAAPTIQATSGNFAIEGKTGLKLQTATDSNADIAIDPNGTGKLNIYLGGATGNQMIITDANITHDALVSVYAETSTTGFDLLNLSSGLTEATVFSVDESGHTYVAGNLGIGTTNPGAALDVGGGSGQLADGVDDVLIKGDLEVDDDVRIDGGEITTSVATTWDLADSTTSLNIESGLLNLDTQSSYVGIGTTGPSQKLHIAGNMRLTGAFHDVNDESGSSNQILSSTGSGTDWVDITSVGVGGSGTINYIPKFTASTTLGNSLLYDDGTNVGIGNTNPTAKLDITGTLKASSTITFSVLATNGPVYTTAGGALNSEQYLNVSRGGTGLDGSSASNGQLLIGNGSGYTLNTLTAGVGIGITNASGSITINHDDTSSQESSDNSDLTFIQDITLDTFGHLTGLKTNTITASNGLTATGLDIELGGSLEKLTKINLNSYDFGFYGTGNVGIGTTGPGFKLEVAGDIGPDGDGTRDIGSSSRYYDTVYANNVVGTGALGYWNRNSGSGYLYPHTSGDDVVPQGTADLGLSETQWNYLYVNNIDAFTLQGNVTGNSKNITDLDDFSAKGIGGGTTTDMTADTVYLGNTSYYVNSSGVARLAKFEDQGDTSYYLDPANSTTSLLVNGNVGIGTTNPTYKLEVNGTGYFAQVLSLGTQATITSHAVRADRTLTFNSDTNVTITDSGAAQNLTDDRSWTLGWTGTLAVSRGGSGAGTFTKGVLLSPGGTDAFTTVAGTDNYLPKWSSSYLTITSSIYDNGNVGIGTTNPSSFKLEIDGDIGPDSHDDHNLGSDTKRWNTIYVNNLVGSGALGYWKRNSGTAVLYPNTAGDHITTTGNIGIGSTGVPSQALDISLASGNMTFSSSTGPHQILTGGTTDLALMPGGNVGIGTTGPSEKLDVESSGATFIEVNSTGSTTDAGIKMVDTGGTWLLLTDDSDSDKFQIRRDSGIKLTMDTNGNVGIGTTGPGFKLEVAGDIGPDGNSTRNIGSSSKHYNTIYVNNITGTGDLGYWERNGTVLSPATDNDTLQVGDGSAPAPAYSFENDADTGLYRITTDKLALATGATPRIAIDATGQVGIGTTNPTYKLEVNGTGYFAQVLSLGTQATITSHAVRADRTLTFNSDTNVTITDSGAAQNLTDDRSWTLGWTGTLAVSRGGSGAGTFTKGVLLSPGGTDAFTTVAGTDNYLPKWSSSYLTITSSIYDNGNVGIGTTGPGALLHVGSAGSPGTVNGIDDLYVYDDLEVDGTIYGDGSGISGVTANPGGNDGDIQYNNNGVMGGADGFYWDDTNKYVGIGTTGPGKKLDVVGDIRSTGDFIIDTWGKGVGVIGGGNSHIIFNNTAPNLEIDFGTAGSSRLDIMADTATLVSVLENGNVGIGTVTPDGTLHVHTATAGVVTAATNYDDLVVENSGHGGITILVPDASQANIAFGSLTDNIGALIRWEHDSDLMTIGTANTGAEVQFFTGNQVEAMRFDTSGNVGIGTTSPLAKLTVVDSTYSINFRNAGGPRAEWGTSTDGNAFMDMGAYDSINNIGTMGRDFRILSSSVDPIMYMEYDTGNIGIGTTTPWKHFVVAESDAGQYAEVVVGESSSLFGGMAWDVDNNQLSISAKSHDYPILIGPVSVGGVFIDTDTNAGNVGIGTTGPGAKLHVNAGNINVEGYVADEQGYGIVFDDGGGDTDFWISRIDSDGNAGSDNDRLSIGDGTTIGTNEFLSIDTSGNVGIGTAGPGYKLEVAGDGAFTSTANPGLTVGDGTTGHLKVGGSKIYDADAAGYLTLDSDGVYTVITDDLDVKGNEIIFGEEAQTIGDYGNGVYIGNASYFSFETEGTNVGDLTVDTNTLFVDASTNRVGIGTVSPVLNLQVTGNNANTWSQPSAGVTDGTAAFLFLLADDINDNLIAWDSNRDLRFGTGGSTVADPDAAFSEKMRIETGGNVGIGTAEPGHKLDITSTTDQDGIIIDAVIYPEIRFKESNTIRGYVAVAGSAGGFGTGTLANSMIVRAESDMHLITNAGTVVQTLTSGGNVGIGTASPGGKLQVDNTDDSYLLYGSSGNIVANNPEASTADVRLGAAWDRPGVYSSKQLELFSDTTGIIFGDSNVERMRLTAAGNVGIGTASPSTKLHTYNSASGQHNYLTIENTQAAYQAAVELKTGTTNADWIMYIPGSSTDLKLYRGGDKVTFQAGGNVGIGTGSPTHKLEVTGTGTNIFSSGGDIGVYGSGSVRGVQGDGGTYGVYGTGTYGVYGSGTYGVYGVGPWGGYFNGKGYFSGNVGIGTITPGDGLEVTKTWWDNSATDWGGGIRLSGNYPTVAFWPSGQTTNFMWHVNDGLHVYRRTTTGSWQHDAEFETNGNAYFGLNGHVGIGTESPQGQLHLALASAADIYLQRSDSTIPSGAIRSFGTSGGSLTYGGQIGIYNGGTFFKTDSSPSNTTDNTIISVSITNVGDLLVRNGGICAATGDDCPFLNDGDIRWDNVGLVYDLAEYFYTETRLDYGNIVTTANRSTTVKNADKPYQEKLIGIVSTNPNIVFGIEDANGNMTYGGTGGEDTKVKDDKAPIVIAGRAPMKVSNANGNISYGDKITSSSLPGIGMKATKAGLTIGTALENFEFDSSTCQNVGSLDSAIWPEDDGSNSAKPCFRLPDGTYVGKLIAFVNVSWYDPDVYLTDAGDLSIAENNDGTAYELKDSQDNLITRIGAFAEVVVARIKAGLIETTNLIAENVVVEKKIISPLAEVETIKTDLISPLSEDGDITVKLAQDDTGSKETYDPVSNKSKFKIINEQEIEVASIDAKGNATFSGTLEAEEVHAKRIVAEEIVGLEARIANLTAETTINNYYYEEATEEDAVPPSDEATESALLAQLEEEIDQILNTEYSSLDSTNLDVDSGIFNEFLAVLGQASIVNLEVTNALVINDTMQITNNSIGVIGDDSILYIQPAGIGIINMMAGKFVIDEKGNVTIEGNLAVKGSLFVNEIRPLPDQDVVIDLANNDPGSGTTFDPGSNNEEELSSGFGKLIIKGLEDKTVASIDSSGNLTASGSATFKKLNIATAESTPSGTLMHPAITTNATTGTATLPAGSTEFTVYNEQVTDQSLIYITPISETQNKVLYVKAKNGGDGWFKVAIDAPIDNEVKFNWWIIN